MLEYSKFYINGEDMQICASVLTGDVGGYIGAGDILLWGIIPIFIIYYFYCKRIKRKLNFKYFYISIAILLLIGIIGVHINISWFFGMTCDPLFHIYWGGWILIR